MFNETKELAYNAAMRLRQDFSIQSVTTAIVLGTGWGDTLQLTERREIPFNHILGLGDVEQLNGHARNVLYGRLNDKEVIALQGRIHLNEAPCAPDIPRMVRLQVQMLLELGVEYLILTCAAGSLSPHVEIGDVVVIDGFVTLFAPAMPLYAGEFCSPEDTLDESLRQIALEAGQVSPRTFTHQGGYIMLRGPFFEGRKYDKPLLAKTGAYVVGMSVLPEACVASLYSNVKVLAIAFVSNSAIEEHSHAMNLNRAGEFSERLGNFLTQIVAKI